MRSGHLTGHALSAHSVVMFYLMPVELHTAELMIDLLSRRLHGPAACLKSRMVWLREA